MSITFRLAFVVGVACLITAFNIGVWKEFHYVDPFTRRTPMDETPVICTLLMVGGGLLSVAGVGGLACDFFEEEIKRLRGNRVQYRA